MKICLTSLTIGEIPIKNKMIFAHCSESIKHISSVEEGVEKNKMYYEDLL